MQSEALVQEALKMRDDHPGQVPDYTPACVVMFGVNLTWILVAVWAVWGLIAALCLCYGLNLVLDRLPRWRETRRAAAIRRGKR